jgi:hypothetical protein
LKFVIHRGHYDRHRPEKTEFFSLIRSHAAMSKAQKHRLPRSQASVVWRTSAAGLPQ